MMRPATRYPAAPENFAMSRGGNRVDRVIIHTTESTAMSALSWFRSPRAGVSAHYVIGHDGALWACVPEDACAWHAGNREYNLHSIGIECEGHAGKIETWTAPLLATLTDLITDLCLRYGIVPTRQTIIGHAEVPDPYRSGSFGGAGGHTDPGMLIPWDFIVGEVQKRLSQPAAPEGIA